MLYQIVSFYRFVSFPRARLAQMREVFIKEGERYQIKGLILLSEEGINGSLSGQRNNMNHYLKTVEDQTNIKDFFYKKSPSPRPAFKRLNVKIKKEIITFGKTGADLGFHDLQPDEWEAMLKEEQVTVLDIRNNYEVELGRFKKAQDLNLKEFTEFPQKLKSRDLPKKQKTLLYCTGGIRCEKAIKEMKKQGFNELYQLKGGIIHYLKSFPNQSFKGECFVFDRRVAVDQNLKPTSKYSLCPHCGQAGGQPIRCVHCGKKTKICQHCLQKGTDFMTCTKNCAYHFRKGHKCKRPRQQ